MSKTTVTLAIDDESFDVVGDYEPSDPGRTYGPPEDCYPPTDASLDITHVWLAVPRGRIDLCAMPAGMIAESFFDRLRNAAIEQLEDTQPSDFNDGGPEDDDIEYRSAA